MAREVGLVWEKITNGGGVQAPISKEVAAYALPDGPRAWRWCIVAPGRHGGNTLIRNAEGVATSRAKACEAAQQQAGRLLCNIMRKGGKA